MNTLELKHNLYWTGIQDPALRSFDIIMETQYGTSYNSYMIKGTKKTALIETAKFQFYEDYLSSLKQLVDISQIDYIIMNHTEPDHSGSIEQLLDLNPDITICGTMGAINFLKEIINHDFCSQIIKSGDILSLGDKTLQFFPAPQLHWPDTMYTYLKEDEVLFTCDSFGAHYSHDGVLRSSITDSAAYMNAVTYYFDHIISPFAIPYMQNALALIEPLSIDMVCTGHGPVLDSHIDEVLDCYKKWCTPIPKTKPSVVIAYVSAYGYTKELAESIDAGILDSGEVTTALYNMELSDTTEVVSALAQADGILLGSPTILGDALKPIWSLTLSMSPVTHRGKLAGAFGSYGWSGEAVPNLLERLKQLKLNVIDGYRVKFKPSSEELKKAYEYGVYVRNTILNKK
ncbi:MAG: FprA family A-type flavoprotein [Lachnospiraceae bacterium]